MLKAPDAEAIRHLAGTDRRARKETWMNRMLLIAGLAIVALGAAVAPPASAHERDDRQGRYRASDRGYSGERYRTTRGSYGDRYSDGRRSYSRRDAEHDRHHDRLERAHDRAHDRGFDSRRDHRRWHRKADEHHDADHHRIYGRHAPDRYNRYR